MKPGNPWSVKGIQPAARQAAKEAARRHGMTLGQWLNHVIMDSNEEQADTAAEPQPVQPQQPASAPAAPQPAAGTAPKAQHLHDKIEDLAARLDSIVNKQSGQVDLDQWEAERGRSSGWSDIAVRTIDREEPAHVVSEPVSEAEPDPAPNPAPEGKSEIFGDRISALTDKLDSVVQARAATKSHSDQSLMELETALRNVINHIEISDRQNTDVMKSIQARLSELSSRNSASNNSTVQHLSGTVSEIDERLAHLSRRVLKTETVSDELQEFEEKINALANRLDNSLDLQTEAQILALEKQTQRLALQFDEFLKASKDTHAADQIDVRLTEISSRVNATEQQCQRFTSLENSINQLFDAVEQNRNIAQENIFSASQKSIETMETMVEHAAHKAAENAAQRSAKHVAAIMADDGLNKKEIMASIADLRDQMDTSRQAAIKTMQDGIGETISASLSSQVTKAIAEPMMVLREEFDQLHNASKSAELRNQDTLEAVHDTLEKVVERLVTLETSPQQDPDRPPLPSLSIPDIDLVSPAGHEQDFHISHEQDFHISDDNSTAPAHTRQTEEPEPDIMEGSVTSPDTHATYYAPALPSQHDARIDPVFSKPEADKLSPEKKIPENPAPALNHNYLEAARRAALAASQMPRNLADTSEDEEHSPTSKSSLLAMATESDKKRKTLLLVAAAVLLIFGALSAGSLVTGNPSVIASSSVESPAIVTGKDHSTGTPSKTNRKSADDQAETPREKTKPAPSPVSQNISRTPVKTVQISKGPATPRRAPAANPQLAQSNRAGTLAAPGTGPAASPEITASVTPPDNGTGTPPAGRVKVARLSAPAADTSNFAKEAPAASPSIPLPPEAIGPIALRRAAAAGDAIAQFEIAARFTSGKLVPQNFNKAVFWYQKAAAQGLAPAQYRLGTFYEKGRGVAQDKTAARIWYERAAEKGNLKAIHNLAVIYADGSKGKPDFAKAGLWFRKAAELGLADSQYNLAILHDRGLGVSKDPSTAYFWFQIAGKQGDKDALARAAIIEKRMTADQIARTKLLISNWSPLTLNKSANEVALPFDGWQSVATLQTTPSATERNHSVQKDLVALAQGYLARLGFEPGPDDGILGGQTREAIEKFQQQHQLPVSGDVTPALVSKLKAAAG